MTQIILHERKKYDKMIFVAGPRQVGKTTVFRQIIDTLPGRLMNWDNIDDRAEISKTPYRPFESEKNLYLDEIHKYPRWKNYLKGAFDTYGSECRIHVTGSARLDVYRRGGDSMVGRYHLFRLHPFSVAEILSKSRVPEKKSIDELLTPETKASQEAWEVWRALEKFGGFPEPFYAQSEKLLKQWRQTRHERLVREDIRDMTRIRELALLEQMLMLIPERTSQLLSLNALREDIEVSHDTIRLWLSTLQEFYYLFLVSPYSRKIVRGLKKEKKLYLWDYAEIVDQGARFENMVASHLLKWVHCWTDLGFEKLDFFYIRDKQKNEVDFLITKDRKPWFLVEAKKSDQTPSQNLLKFARELGTDGHPLPTIQLIDSQNTLVKRNIAGIHWTLCSASLFFQGTE